MAPEKTALTTKVESGTPYQLDPSQTLLAATALLNKIKSKESERQETTGKADLLADNDEEDSEDADAVPVWLVMATKKHIVDKKSLKPGKITLPHPLHNTASPTLRICLISADPQRLYKELVAHPSFPPALSARIARVIGLEKLKAKYKSYESRRQLLGEYDIFLADDRIITYLPTVLGKIFYSGGSKRPVPVNLEGKKEDTREENGAKRVKLSEGGKKVNKAAPNPVSAAKEIEKAISSALVHLSPSTNTSVKVGKATMTSQQLAENVEAVVNGLTEKFVTKGWRNVRGIHIKGPNTVSLPIWLAEELWEGDADVLEQAPDLKAISQASTKEKKRKRSLLTQGPAKGEEVKEIAAAPTKSKKRKSDGVDGDDASAKTARKEALKRQKQEARVAVQGVA